MKSSMIAMAVAATLLAEAEAGTSTGGSGKVKFASKEYDLDTGEFAVTFGNGKVVSCNVDSLPDQMKRNLMFHGIAQKVGDSYAGAKGNFESAITSASDVISQLQAGEWRSSGDGEARPRLGELSAAIARVKGVPLEEATAAVNAAAALDGDEAAKKAGAEKLKTWRAHPKIKAAIAAIRAEKAQQELEAAGDQGGEISLG